MSASSTESDLKTITLSVSCVTYALDTEIVKATLGSLACACELAQQQGVLTTTHLYLIDNGPDHRNKDKLIDIQRDIQHKFTTVELISGYGNVGYGRGHNLALSSTRADYHLVLNPDVLLAEDNIQIALDYMNKNPQVGLLAPDAMDEFGNRQFIAKRTPSLLVLLLRAFPFRLLHRLMIKKLNDYECRDLIPANKPVEIELASGCYMFLRTSTAQQVGGFDPDFFMYFEDFDLSLRIANLSQVVHHPELKIVHYGGGASKKGLLHLRYFFVSYFQFLVKSLRVNKCK